MYLLKGFIEIGPLRDSVPNKLSPVGELSSWSATYARDKTNYRLQNQQVELFAFTSKQNELDVTVPAKYTDNVLNMAQWVYDNAINGTIKNDQEAFQRLLVGRYPDTITNVSVGGMIGYKGNWFPRSITWKLETDEDNLLTVWFTDEDFRRGYRDYTIIIVPPVEPVDTFHATVGVVGDALKGFNLPTHHNVAKDKAQGIPYTMILSHNFTWHDRENYETSLPTTWSVLIWGAAGANPSNIKKAYRDQILANSEYPYSDWVKVFPEIFTSTRFTFVPSWNKRGVPNQENDASLYSPILPYKFTEDVIDKLVGRSTDADPSKINTPLTEVTNIPTLYKSLNTVCFAGNENLKEYQSIYDIIPRYSLIHLGSPDIGYVDKDTNDFMRLFYEALIVAEEYQPYAQTENITVMFDDVKPDIKYAVFEFKNIEFRVVMRTSKWTEE